MTTTLEIMHKMFREQHRQLIEEQKRLLDDYKQYFSGVLTQMEEEEAKKLIPPPAPPKQEDMSKEITEIGIMLDTAIKTYGKELADILIQLTEKHRKKAEASSKEISEIS